RGLDGLLIQSEDGVQRFDDVCLAHRAVLHDDALDDGDALNLGTHRFRGVARTYLPNQLRRFDAVPHLVVAAAGAAARAGPEAVAVARPDAAPLAGSAAAVRAGALRHHRRRHRGLEHARLHLLRVGRGLGRDVERRILRFLRRLLRRGRRRLPHRDRDLVRTRQFGLLRRLLHLVAAAATAAAWTGLVQPDDVLRILRRLDGAAEIGRRRVPEDEQRDDQEEAVRRERAADTKAGLPALERERQLGRVQAFDLHRDVSVACYRGSRPFGHQAITVIVPRLVWIAKCKKAALAPKDWRP